MINRTDYFIHFLCGIVISYALWSFGWWWSLVMVTIIGGVKEIVWDMWMKKGTPEVVDFLCTVAGFIPVILIETVKDVLL